MKKLIPILLASTIIISGCNDTKQITQPIEIEVTDAPVETADPNAKISIILPAEFFKGQVESEIVEAQKAQGITAVKNSDDTYTYTMTQSLYETSMTQMKSQMDSNISRMPESFQSISLVTHNDDFSEYTVSVDKDKYASSDDSLIFDSLNMFASIFNAFVMGNKTETVVTVIDRATNNEIEVVRIDIIK